MRNFVCPNKNTPVLLILLSARSLNPLNPLLLIIAVYTFMMISVQLSWNHMQLSSLPDFRICSHKYRILILIVTSFFFFVSSLDMLHIFSGLKMKSWFALIYNLNWLIDPAIYILAHHRLKEDFSNTGQVTLIWFHLHYPFHWTLLMIYYKINCISWVDIISKC